MNEPNKGLVEAEQMREMVRRALENRDVLRGCPKHHFFPILDAAGDHYGHYRCAHCCGEINSSALEMYSQGVRDGEAK